MKHVLFAAAAIGLSACATAGAPSYTSAEAVAAGTKISVNETTGKIEAIGPQMKGKDQTWYVAATRSPSDAEWRYQVRLAADLDSWANFAHAQAGGKDLDMSTISKGPLPCRAYYRGGCGLQEVVGVNFAAADAHAMASSGLTYSVHGDKSQMESTVPAYYVKGVMDAVASYDGKR